MSGFRLIQGSCVDQEADAIVNAANRYLMAGGGICGAIFRKAGAEKLAESCAKHSVPLNDGDAVITPAYGITNAKYVIHAVGPDFGSTPTAFKELYLAYYNSLVVLKDNDLHTIAFPLISSGLFGGALDNPVAESTKQAIEAYDDFVKANPDYDVDVTLCAFTEREYAEANKVVGISR